jgi:hypothetical protein
MVVTTLALFLMPVYRHPTSGLETSGFQSIVGNILSAVAIVLPSFVSEWIDAWTQSPFLFTSLVLFLTGLILYARDVAQFIHLLGEAGWWHVKKHQGQCPALPKKGRFERLADWAFDNPLVIGSLRLINRSLMWIILALVVLFLIGKIQ